LMHTNFPTHAAFPAVREMLPHQRGVGRRALQESGLIMLSAPWLIEDCLCSNYSVERMGRIE
jgi:hypothetical protein